MDRRNLIFSSCMAGLGILALVLIRQFDAPMFQDASVDASFFPTVIAIAIIGLSVAIVIQDKLKAANHSQPIFSKRALMGMGFLFGYAIAIHFAGYLLATLTAFTIYLLACKIRKPTYYLTAWTFVAAIYYLFGEVFVIALPQGIWF
ncbi:tripartite tricarboxylate transporter TctB family protein [Thaumasiovibrio subtropicus]|uniref:tripartite tricarboxylate transporter TctB family protein n=1 Tax=Thaumasiovibrio subtropicus TaxID=1891207 RepID=UPI000B360199|nr:tripartite tricarboxylate transporter TctB family protein [Thaumasiovibrio subtropicus]